MLFFYRPFDIFRIYRDKTIKTIVEMTDHDKIDEADLVVVSTTGTVTGAAEDGTVGLASAPVVAPDGATEAWKYDFS